MEVEKLLSGVELSVIEVSAEVIEDEDIVDITETSGIDE